MDAVELLKEGWKQFRSSDMAQARKEINVKFSRRLIVIKLMLQKKLASFRSDGLVTNQKKIKKIERIHSFVDFRKESKFKKVKSCFKYLSAKSTFCVSDIIVT